MITEWRTRHVSWRQPWLAALLVAASAGTVVSAHRLDEYLQAARIDVRHEGLVVELDLTPGTIVAPAVIATIDRNRDTSFDADEQRAYAIGVTQAMAVALDGEGLRLRVEHATFPDLAALQRGEGTIGLRLRADRPIARGSHRVSMTNGHLPSQSVYLANALLPDDARITIGRQRRSPDQRHLDFDVTVEEPRHRMSTGIVLLGVFAILLFVRRARI